MIKKIIIIGASGHGKVAADIAKLNGYEEIFFIDDDMNKKYCGQYQVIGTSQDFSKYKEEYDFFVAIGSNDIRKKIYEKLKKMNVCIAKLIHPTAVIDNTVSIGEGTIVMANVVVNADVRIGNACIINTSSSIDHECKLGDFVHISPGTHIAGNVHIGSKTWIGIGSSIINNIIICDECVVGAGSVVIKKIEKKGTYVGIPVRRIK